MKKLKMNQKSTKKYACGTPTPSMVNYSGDFDSTHHVVSSNRHFTFSTPWGNMTAILCNCGERLLFSEKEYLKLAINPQSKIKNYGGFVDIIENLPEMKEHEGKEISLYMENKDINGKYIDGVQLIESDFFDVDF
ncbi:hypothetical protein [Carboxylicivirga caseinilyticus]|uniref:hypothetical protein n=1 Tax=Carboxylicivirga caseinilyticus TaxID=3417572 RepID=UPI003D34A03A|nr:hypothetical protein [Marinilabiliaceae bacterium A049]